MTLKFAIWDMDGTLIDSRSIIQSAMVSAFQQADLVPPAYDQTRHVVGLDLEVALQTLSPAGCDIAALTNDYKQAFIEQRKDPSFREPLYEGALETLERLVNENWLIGVATGKSRHGLHAIIERHDLSRYFDTLWCADDGPGKPNPFMCLEAMKAVGADASQSLIIGDAVHDMRMGRSAGITTLGVDWGFGEAQELSEAGAHQVYSDFASLNKRLDQFAMEAMS